MAIKGLTDQASIKPRLPSLGKLRKGGEKVKRTNKDGKEYETYGEDLNHFRFTSERSEIVQAFEDAYGEQPAAIPVYLPYPTVAQNFETWKEKWQAGGLVHRCDGETMQLWLGQDGKYHREPKPCPYHGKTQNPEEKKKDPPCDEIGRLELILPQLWLAGYVGYVTLETHSINDLIAISESLEAAYLSRQELGNDLTGLEFILRRVPENISVPGWGANAGRRQRVDKWLVKIEPSASWVRLQLEAKQRQAERMLEDGEHAALPAGGPRVSIIEPEPEPETETQPQTEQPKQAGNGNGNGSTALPPMSLATAPQIRTPKGAPVYSLTVEQLQMLASHKDASPEQKSAARFYLADKKAASGDLDLLADLHVEASAQGIDASDPTYNPPGNLLTAGEVRKAYSRLEAAIAALTAQPAV